MVPNEYIHEIRGIPRGELEDFFVGVGGEPVALGIFRGIDWGVELKEGEDHILGPMKISSIKIVFRMPEANYLKMLHSFRMRFLHVGG